MTTTVPKMNKERIRHLADVIEKVPHKQMTLGETRHTPASFNMRDYHCGSVACIAGWAAHLFEADRLPEYRYQICEIAAEALGLRIKKAEALFAPYASVPRLSDITPSQAALTLRKLADTGKVDWSHVEASAS